MTKEILFFALKSKKVLDRGPNGVQREDNNNDDNFHQAIFEEPSIN